MKKQLLLLCSIIGSVSIAQPTVTATGIQMAVGNSFTFVTSNFVNPGNSGTNQTWDLSSATTSTTSTSNVVSPSSTPNGSTFPSASVCLSDGASYVYYINNSSAWQMKGVVSPSAVVINYSNPEDMLHFPFTYNNTYVDTWSATFVNGGYTYYREGSTTVTADSYGTLILPNGTYSNVLRVHFHQVYTDSVDLGFPYIINYDNDEYMWYINGNHYPVATMYTFVTDFGNSSGGSYMNNIVGINESANNSNLFSCYPNPAKDELSISMDKIENAKSLKIISTSGAVTYSEEPESSFISSKEKKIDVSSLVSGIYFIEIEDAKGIINRKKIVITK